MSLSQMLEELKKEYVDSLPTRIENIESSLANEQIHLIREEFHKLKGTGRTYGLPEVSQLCETLEEICISRPDLVGQTVPEALNLLRDIHKCRTDAKSFDVISDQRYRRIRNILDV